VLLSRPLRHAAQGVAALVVAAGSVGVAHYDKAVQVSVDGQPSSVHVLGSTVADVLDKQDIEVGPHDVVVPSLGSSVDDGDHISVRYGRKLTVNEARPLVKKDFGGSGAGRDSGGRGGGGGGRRDRY